MTLFTIGFIAAIIIGCFVYCRRRERNKGHASFEFDENKDKGEDKREPKQSMNSTISMEMAAVDQ